jgi:phosphoribosylformylglycinamidine synthase
VRWGSLDPESMAACAVDEAIRNVVCVGADPDRIALLDNFCWGNPERPETLGSLVLAARGASDAARAFRTPFISGKDSLYNEYEHDGVRLAIPTTLLVSAMGIVPNARLAVSMELKKPGHVLLLAGETSEELGGSVWCAVTGRTGGTAPRLDPARARANYLAIHAAIGERLVKSAHDCSDGGLAVALAEMAFAGGLGIDADLGTVPVAGNMEREAAVLFSESPARILLEVPTESVAEIEGLFESRGANRPVPIGRVTQRDRLIITGFEGKPVIDASLAALKTAWKGPRNASGFVDGS